MSENTMLCIVLGIAVAGCSTCRVSDNWSAVERRRAQADERVRILRELIDTPPTDEATHAH
jgi:hypothetical protein